MLNGRCVMQLLVKLYSDIVGCDLTLTQCVHPPAKQVRHKCRHGGAPAS